MSRYREMAETAARMLDEFGQRLSFERAGPGRYDTASGRPSAATLTRWTAMAVQDDEERGQGGGTLVYAGEILLLVAAGIEPRVGDGVVLANGNRATVKAVQPFSPAGEALYYSLKVWR